MIVVDTSVLIDFFRGRRSASVARFRKIEQDGVPFAIPACCCQELLQGAKDGKEWQLLLDHLETQTILGPRDPWDTHLAAARIFFECRRKGVTIRSSWDCYIAQLVIENEGVLLHDDDDFDRIASVVAIRTMRH